MNRRNFFRGLLALGAGFTILPPAETYQRIWQAIRPIVLPPAGCGSVTLCNANPITAAELEAIYLKGADYKLMDALFKHDFEILQCGGQPTGLHDFLVEQKRRELPEFLVRPLDNLRTERIMEPMLI